MSDFLYIIGQPGSGKSTLVKHLTAGAEPMPAKTPLAHIMWLGSDGSIVTEIGAEREQFRGTDALAMDAQKKALPWIASRPCVYMLAEGDRLANMKFFEAVRDAGYDLTVVHLNPPDDVVASRRAAREEELGKKQNPGWVQGRITKNRNLADQCGAIRVPFADVNEQMEFLSEHPVVQALR